MLLKSSVLTASALLTAMCSATPGVAQLYPGQDVSVGPAAGGQVLLYPGGKYQRVLPPLLQPGEPYPGVGPEPIRLHRPIRHREARMVRQTGKLASVAPIDSASQQGSASDTHQETPAAAGQASTKTAPHVAAAQPGSEWRRKHGAIAQVATSTPEADSGIPFSLYPDAAPVAAPPAAQAPTQNSSPPQKTAPHGPTPPKAVAMVSPSAVPAAGVLRQPSPGKPESGERTNLSKRGAILFEKGAPDPTPAQYRGVQLLAGGLNSALEAGAARVQLEAYGGAPGDKSSDARRLSLKRALAVRQLLIDDGVPSSRIDVRAMGGTDDRGPADRVDVFVRAG